MIIKTKQDIKNITQALVTISFFLALYSLINHYTNGSFEFNSSLTPYSNNDWNNRVRGAFSYHAHYSAFLNMTIPLGLALTYDSYKKEITTRRNKFLTFITSTSVIYFFCTIVMLLALIKTNSRGGNASFIIALFFTSLTITVVNFKDFKLKKYLLSLFIVTIPLIMFIISSNFSHSLISRYINDGTDLHGRQYAYNSVIKIIKEEPILGVGLGNYSDIAKRIKPFEMGLSMRSKHYHAMNDYLEILVEQGVIGLTLFLIFILASLRKIITFLKWNKSLFPYLAASVCSSVTILIHSLGDFVMQLPVITLYFLVIIALGLKSCSIQVKRK